MSECKSRHAGIGAATLLYREFDSGFRHVEKDLTKLEEKTREGLLGKNPFFTNFGVIPEGVTDYGIPAKTAWMLGPVEYPPGFGLAACTYRGRLTLSAGFSGEALDRDWVCSLLSSVAKNLCRFTSQV
jgi:NRPS condensation-like uncharacterized protein